MNDQHSFKNIACSDRLQENSPDDDQNTPTKTPSCNPQIPQPQNQLITPHDATANTMPPPHYAKPQTLLTPHLVFHRAGRTWKREYFKVLHLEKGIRKVGKSLRWLIWNKKLSIPV